MAGSEVPARVLRARSTLYHCTVVLGKGARDFLGVTLTMGYISIHGVQRHI